MIIEKIVVITDCTALERDKIVEKARPTLTSDAGDMLIEVELPLDAVLFPARYRRELEEHIEAGISKILVIGG